MFFIEFKLHIKQFKTLKTGFLALFVFCRYIIIKRIGNHGVVIVTFVYRSNQT